ncbi:3-oxoacyl-ACP reductase family protein [Chitinophaga sp. Cy-1792]|uniref:3-oxoacyl-ACP reductase family protein n=1 Tax=Chitinophaga sp. Cy-1792 TaxID=2608339 RepID=UPI0014248E39|nr:3-oxoacyl-ACP reductase family protein [Chitinophaga sp. Cy-1792]NIG53014.1 3-oxoacyl-ACP reductase FabG [Chitinophaga sp. Cy-1792]
MKRLDSKVALVTGGSRGIGAAIAARLASEGADVIITYAQSEQRAEEVLKAIENHGRKGKAIKADSASATAVRDAVLLAVKEFGRIDILVNNAGTYTHKLLEDYTLEEYEHMMAVNTRAVFVATQEAARHMPSGGRIITIGSNMAERVAFPGGALYAMSKSALTGFNKGIARDLGSKGITANLVQPGPTDTEMNPANSDFAPVLAQQTALGRYGTVNEVASLVSFLAGPDSSFITGTEHTIDAGFNI